MVSFLFAVLLLTVPLCPAICKSGGHVPPVPHGVGATGCGRVFSHPPIGYDLATRKWNSGLENSQCTPFTANQKEAGQRLLTTARFVVTG